MYSPAAEPRSGWIESIGDARAEIEQLLEMSPSLKGEVENAVKAETRRAIKLAMRDLEGHRELGAGETPSLRATAYTPDQILGDWFPPEPPRE